MCNLAERRVSPPGNTYARGWQLCTALGPVWLALSAPAFTCPSSPGQEDEDCGYGEFPAELTPWFLLTIPRLTVVVAIGLKY